VEHLHVVAQGLISALGYDLASNVAAVKAGINSYQETNYVGPNHERYKAAFVPDEALPALEDTIATLPKLSERYKRLLQIAAPSVNNT